jgi:endo-1,4-beta-xylanase
MNDDIKRNRTAAATVTVLKADTKPLANQEVTVSQVRHKFLFGTAAFELVPLVNSGFGSKTPEDAQQWTDKFLALCNAATLPFYWARFEPERGKPMTKEVQNAAKWCLDHQLVTKGHPLCWHTLTADWLLEMSNAEILQAQIARIQRDVADFRGLIDMWDVLNEAVIMPVFDKYDNGITRLCKEIGRINTIKAVFEATRATNPSATLLLNDFDVSDAYDILVEGCLEAGIKIDVIGIQSHMHQGYWGVEKTLQVLSHFERFHLPIHFTETTLVSGQIMPPEIVDLNDYQVEEWPTTPAGEERQAREAIQHYTTLLAHPLVEGITWWSMSDGGWLNAPAGLLRADGSSKPAYDEILKLVKGEWWMSPTKLATDSQGKIQFSGFEGEYELSYAGKQKPFSLTKEDAAAIEVQL